MTEDNRNSAHDEGTARQGRDPLRELTRLFNLDFNANKNSPVTSTPNDSSNDRQQSVGDDDADPSFLETSPQDQSPQNVVYTAANSASEPQVIDNDLDFLSNDGQQQPMPHAQEPDLPFNELYDLPSFIPQARSSGEPVEKPIGFENEQLNTSPSVPIEREPVFAADEESPNYSSLQNQNLPEDFDFIPEPNQPTSQSQNVGASFTASPPPLPGSFTQAAGSNSTTSYEATRDIYPDNASSPAPEKAPMQQQYSAFNEMQFDSELENLLVNAPLAEDDGTNVPLRSSSNETPNFSNKSDIRAQQNLNKFSNSEASFVDQSQVDNPASRAYNSTSQLNPDSTPREASTGNANFGYSPQAGNNLAPLPYTPPASDHTIQNNDFLNSTDPIWEDNDFFNSQQPEKASETNHGSQPAIKPLPSNAADPFGLEDLSVEENVIVNPPVYPDNSEKEVQPNNFNTTEDHSTPLPIEGQKIEPIDRSDASFQQEYVQIQPKVQIGQPVPTKYTDEDNAHYMSSSVAEEAGGNNGYDQNADTPPDVNTYKFADEIVETTEPVDVPEIPYPAEETTQKGDALENEFADVFNVGNKQETTDKLAEQDEFFADAYAQSGYNLKQNQADNNAAEPQYQSDNAYKAYENSGQNVSTENITVTDFQNQRRSKSLARKLITSGFALFIVVGGGYAATKYFMPSQENGTSTVIHADNEPFKVPAEQNSTNNDTQNNQDVYNHANGTDDSVKDNQDKLVDRSETPEDLTALNNTPEGADSYTNPSNVEDAIAAASDQTVPTREVQSVIVNPDGTISPSKTSPADDVANSNNTQTKTAEDAAPTKDEENTASKTANAHSEEKSVSTDESEVAKIINDDALTNGENKNNSTGNAVTAHNDFSGLNSVKIPQQKPQAQPVQTADLNSEHPASLTSTTSVPETKMNKSDRTAPMASVGAGGYYVQIASQPTRESAVVALNKAKSSFGSLFGSLPLSIEPATIPGKGTYYRVRVQVGPRDNAVSICDSIKSQNGNCFVGK